MNEAAKKLGALGGRAGRGDSKRRSKAFYKKISAMGVAARKRRNAKSKAALREVVARGPIIEKPNHKTAQNTPIENPSNLPKGHSHRSVNQKTVQGVSQYLAHRRPPRGLHEAH